MSLYLLATGTKKNSVLQWDEKSIRSVKRGEGGYNDAEGASAFVSTMVAVAASSAVLTPSS
jgi:hypothetical protein